MNYRQGKVMEDITNYPQSTNQATFTKETSNQKMDIEQEPTERRPENASYPESEGESNIQTKAQPMVQLLKSYSSFVNESADINLDMGAVLDRLSETTRTLKPPSGASARTMEMWNYLLELEKPSIESYSKTLKAMPESSLRSCAEDIEKLHLKLIMEHNTEMERGRRLGIISSSNNRFD